MKQHILRAIVLVLLLSAGLGYLAYTRFDVFVPPLASAEGAPIDRLLRLEFLLIMVVFSLVVGFALYAVFAFRRRPGEEGEGLYIHGQPVLEVSWTLIPLVIVLGLSAITTRDFFQIRRPEYDLLVRVRGQQFAWVFEYPDQGVKSGELVLPVGQRVKFEITSADVVHSFWVPEWRIKEDAVPGLTNHMYITPTELGTFKVRCAELCGAGHANMRALVKVVSQEEFQNWLLAQKPPSDPVALGQRIVEQYCVACHTLDGSDRVGPTFLGVFGREETFEDGTTQKVDEDYIRESIRDPNAKVVQGFPPVMPTFGPDQLSDEEVDAIIAFLKTLKR